MTFTDPRWSEEKKGNGGLSLFRHAQDWERGAVGKRDIEIFKGDVAFDAEEFCAREGCAHFETLEAGGAGGGFAGVEKERADAAACPGGVDEEGANFCGVLARVEQSVFTAGPAVAAVESLPFAPAAAADDDGRGAGRGGFGNEVGAIGDELCINAEDGLERAFDLRGSVVMCLQFAGGGVDERAHGGDVCGSGLADVDIWGHRQLDAPAPARIGACGRNSSAERGADKSQVGLAGARPVLAAGERHGKRACHIEKCTGAQNLSEPVSMRALIRDIIGAGGRRSDGWWDGRSPGSRR